MDHTGQLTANSTRISWTLPSSHQTKVATLYREAHRQRESLHNIFLPLFTTGFSKDSRSNTPDFIRDEAAFLFKKYFLGQNVTLGKR